MIGLTKFVAANKKNICDDIFFESDLKLLSILVSKKFNKNKFLLLNLGTGTTAIKYDNKKIETYLGWGKAIGDIGSGYDIGINFIRFCTICEDKKNKNQYYKNFLKENNIKSIREYIPLMSDVENITKISLWINNQGTKTIKEFIIPRVEKVLDYLSFLNYETLFCTGSILIKNRVVKDYIKKKFNDVQFIEFKDCI